MGKVSACALCGGDLSGRRTDARFCSGVCRAEASRLRRLLGGVEVDGYQSFAERLAGFQRRTNSLSNAVSDRATVR